MTYATAEALANALNILSIGYTVHMAQDTRTGVGAIRYKISGPGNLSTERGWQEVT